MGEIDKSIIIFKALSEKTRIRIIKTIYEEEKNVSQIASDLNMSQSAISHQLKILRIHNIVKRKRLGKEAYYCLSDNHIKGLIDNVFTHVRECEVEL